MTKPHLGNPPTARSIGSYSVRASRALGVALMTLLAGCDLMQGNQVATLRQENERLKREVGRLERESVTTAQSVADLKTQVSRLQYLGAKRLDMLYHADRLEIEQLSGGYDDDKLPGDDGVIVYLRPLDRMGDPVKVAGDIRIELFDLSLPEGQQKLGEHVIAVGKAQEMWYGRFMTYHYTVRCPWQGRPPANPEILVRASFLDYLTGRELNATREVRVLPPPALGAPAG
jgi:hypothetical protein